MRKRTVWAMTAAALVVGGVIGFAVHAPGRSGTWDDVQKWVTFLVIVLCRDTRRGKGEQAGLVAAEEAGRGIKGVYALVEGGSPTG
jgi:hypothetical protein